jgi:phosphatidylglycerol:prolipoprotein diacylglycerol transferase
MDFPGWDPVLIDIPGLPIDVRWYGVMYVVGFVVAQWILVRVARSGFFPIDPDRAGDLIVYCVFGVLLGGRAGYALFYGEGMLNPLEFVKVWKGGLAFHGGLAGVVVAAFLFARKYRLTWGRTADALALAVTPGIFAVRFANFVNGELFGRVTAQGTALAMQFPTDPMAERILGLSHAWTMRDRELCIQVAFGRRTWESVQGLLSQVDEHGRAIDWPSIQKAMPSWSEVKAMRDAGGDLLVPYRHPSQLYEGIGEGLLLGLALLSLYLLTRRRPWRPGSYAAVFLLGYAAIRWSLELVRQPDAVFGPQGTVLLGMTMGQTLSTLMVIGGALVLLWPRRRAGSPAPTGGPQS